jgi:F0F1-type ATP synthase assembly protein I|tara:strand:+ start:113 stop:331 length:219 start_codon:yes stop_codon:yes gene_type:complete
MKEKKKVNLFVRFSSAGIQMALLIIVGALGGQYLDENSDNEKPVYTIIFSLVAVAIGLYLIIKEVLNITEED